MVMVASVALAVFCGVLLVPLSRCQTGPQVAIGPAEELLLEEWLSFKVNYNKAYISPVEEQLRFEIFVDNRKRIAKHNQEFGRGTATFFSRLNSYGDMPSAEFSRVLNGFNRTSQGKGVPPPPRPVRPSAFLKPANTALPDKWDWREFGAVSPVRSQGSCGACYAFSASGALEGHHFRKTGQLVVLSPQQLIDCTRTYGNDGCKGGLMDRAFEHVRDHPGLSAEPAYPYESQEASCRASDAVPRSAPEVVDCTGSTLLPEADEEALREAVAVQGPVSIAIDADQESFQFYAGGVYYDDLCGNQPQDMNHAVLVVGYGHDTSNGREYWIIKNSYGPDWGEGGYMRLARNAANHCGVATLASYPLV